MFKRGYLLLEVLVAMGIVAVVVALAAQSLSVGRSGLLAAGNQTTATGLLTQTFSAVESVARADWDSVHIDLSKGPSHLYHPATTTDAWDISSGTTTINLGGIEYQNSFYVEDVYRNSSGEIVPANQGELDPSTQQVVATVSWPSGGTLTSTRYLTRWPNKICAQEDWVGSDPGSGVAVSCPPESDVVGTADGSAIEASTTIQLTPVVPPEPTPEP